MTFSGGYAKLAALFEMPHFKERLLIRRRRMREIWLRNNRRMLWLGMIPPAVLAAIGLFLAAVSGSMSAPWMRVVGWALVALGGVVGAAVIAQWRAPRLAYVDGKLLVYLSGRGATQVPIEYVECVFLGTGALGASGAAKCDVPTRNLVLRLADRAVDFHRRDVKSVLGRWDDGYITIHGAWCEPLTLDVVGRLNRRLAEIKQAACQQVGSNPEGM